LAVARVGGWVEGKEEGGCVRDGKSRIEEGRGKEGTGT